MLTNPLSTAAYLTATSIHSNLHMTTLVVRYLNNKQIILLPYIGKIDKGWEYARDKRLLYCKCGHVEQLLNKLNVGMNP